MGDCLTVAVSGMIASESPAPGLGVVRSCGPIRVPGRVVGLVYDALRAAMFVEGAIDDAFIMPYPSQGEAEYLPGCGRSRRRRARCADSHA